MRHVRYRTSFVRIRVQKEFATTTVKAVTAMVVRGVGWGGIGSGAVPVQGTLYTKCSLSTRPALGVDRRCRDESV